MFNNEEKRLLIAKEFVIGAGHNINENLRYYNKIKNERISKAILYIDNLIIKEKNALSINELMLLEAKVRLKYYSMFNEIIKNKDFYYETRTIRPPKNPINAMISFGNTILYNLVANEIYKSKLDIRIGFLHQAQKRFESLNLDISEIFRPIIVDKVIFSLINKKMINLDCFSFDSGKVYLNKNGKKIFLNAFENKVKVKLKINGYYYDYYSLIKKEVLKLEGAINDNFSYKSFRYFL